MSQCRWFYEYDVTTKNGETQERKKLMKMIWSFHDDLTRALVTSAQIEIVSISWFLLPIKQ